MNRLSLSTQTQVISCLVEGSSIRSTERMTGVHRDTITRLLVSVGDALIVKFYEADPIGPGRYSPPRVVRTDRMVISGNPSQEHISTSLVERQNLTMRMSMRRFTRLTNAFSKKIENLRAAVALHFAHYNFVRVNNTLQITPAMAAGISSRHGMAGMNQVT